MKSLNKKSAEELATAIENCPLGKEFAETSNPVTRYLAEELALVWEDFHKRVQATEIGTKIDSKTATVEDYKRLLINLRQQVIEGGRWIALAASSMSAPLFPIRSALITHAATEHKDFLMLERNYCALGGTQEEIQTQPKNIGSEAFSAYMFHEAAKADPLNLFGAMFIIEGMGSAQAGLWAKNLQDSLDLSLDQVSFLAYHGENDDSHYETLRTMLRLPFITQAVAERLVKTAKTVGRLYVLQLEELDNV